MIKTSASTLDEIDLALLKLLQENGNSSNADLARQVHLSQPATSARVKRLQDEGFIERTVAVLNREKLGFDLVCLVQIAMQLHQREQEEKFRAAVIAMPEVLECFHVTGEHDYVLKVVVRDRQHLEQFVNAQLTPMLDKAHIQTSLVLSEIKSTSSLL
jgi:Lrp/AsnC family transcriptional regulator, leucine-responsive regulatory protein